MVGIVAGNGLGLLNTSLNILGEAGVLGQSVVCAENLVRIDPGAESRNVTRQ
jgi:hypothetical protein